MRSITLILIPAFLLGLACAKETADAGRLSLGLRAGYCSYAQDDLRDKMPKGASLSVVAAYSATPRIAFPVSLNYLPSWKSSGRHACNALEDLCAIDDMRVRFASVAAGIRFSFYRLGPYVEFAPSLGLGRSSYPAVPWDASKIRPEEVMVTDTRAMLGFQSGLVVPMRITEGRRLEIGVAQQLLHRSHVDPIPDQMSSEGMAQLVRGDALPVQPRATEDAPQHAVDGPA